MIELVASVFARWVEDLNSKSPQIQSQARADWSQTLQEPGDFIMLSVAASILGLSPSVLAEAIQQRVESKERVHHVRTRTPKRVATGPTSL